MNKRELTERSEGAKELLQPRVGGGKRFLGIVPGTGWKEGLEGLFRPDGSPIDYKDLDVPGAESSIEGHSKSMQIGDIDGRPVIVMGRVHPNETTDPDIVLAMRMIIESVRENLDGLIVTNGVGTLHGPVNEHLGRLASFVHTAVLNTAAHLFNGRRSEHVGVGDIAVVDSFDTTTIGKDTPLLAGDFHDLHHKGYHRDSDRFLNLGRDAVAAVQGRTPLAKFAYMHGPQFEGPGEKKRARFFGGDVIGMSALEGLVATKNGIPFSHLVLATNGAFAPHSHEGNLDVGAAKAETTRAILKILARDWPRG